MKVFKLYFLALLLLALLPLTAQDTSESDTGETVKVEEEKPAENSSEEKEEEKEEEKKEEKDAEAKSEVKEEAPAEEKDAEAKPEAKEEAPVVEKKAEAKPEAKEDAPVVEKKAAVKPEAKPDVPAVEKKPVVKPKVVADVAVKGDTAKDGADKDKKDEKDKKFSVSISNGFSHNVAKERKNFAYRLTLGASYRLPWKIGMNASVGISALYRYDMNATIPMDDGTTTSSKVDQGVFDGTPLNIGFGRPIPLFWGIISSLGIGVALPFTSTELWEQYNIYAMLTANAGLNKVFKVAKEASVSFGLRFAYTKTFAKDDYAWDEYQNTVLSPIQEHSLNPGASLSFKYKSFSLAVGAGLNVGRFYSSSTGKYPDGSAVGGKYEDWHYGFSFNASTTYSIKSWNLTLGVTTNAPEKESGGYTGFDAYDGGPEVNNPSANYPFKGKYTRVFANIGYAYSF